MWLSQNNGKIQWSLSFRNWPNICGIDLFGRTQNRNMFWFSCPETALATCYRDILAPILAGSFYSGFLTELKKASWVCPDPGSGALVDRSWPWQVCLKLLVAFQPAENLGSETPTYVILRALKGVVWPKVAKLLGLGCWNRDLDTASENGLRSSSSHPRSLELFCGDGALLWKMALFKLLGFERTAATEGQNLENSCCGQWWPVGWFSGFTWRIREFRTAAVGWNISSPCLPILFEHNWAQFPSSIASLGVLAEQREHLFLLGLKKPAEERLCWTPTGVSGFMSSVQILHLIIAKRPAFETLFALPLWQSCQTVQGGSEAQRLKSHGDWIRCRSEALLF